MLPLSFHLACLFRTFYGSIKTHFSIVTADGAWGTLKHLVVTTKSALRCLALPLQGAALTVTAHTWYFGVLATPSLTFVVASPFTFCHLSPNDLSYHIKGHGHATPAIVASQPMLILSVSFFHVLVTVTGTIVTNAAICLGQPVFT